MSPFKRIAAMLYLFAAPFVAFSQSASTSIRGTVTDPQGATIVGAHIHATEATRGISLDTQTGPDGLYQFLQVQPGEYTVEASADNFGKVSKHIALVVNQPATLGFTLSIGSTTTIVDVSASTITLNLTDASIGNSVQQETVAALPMEGRNIPDLLSLQPGVLYIGRQVNADQDSRSGAVSGARSDQSNLTLDGIDNNNQVMGYAFTGVLRSTIDSVQEFRVTTSNAQAESGRSSGASVSVVTKSGSNAFHGSLYEYNRSSLGQANNWFNKQAELASGLPNRPGKLIRNTFGASLGGPFLKNKLFFFGNYEGQRTSENVQVTRTVPTQSLRQGIVKYIDVAGSTVTLTPAQLSAIDPNCSSMGTCPNGPGVNSASLALFKRYPLPNGSNTGDGLNTGSYSFSAPDPQRLNTGIGRIDYNVSGRHQLFVRAVTQDDLTQTAPQYLGQPASSSLSDGTHGIATGHIWMINASLINNLRYGYTRQAFSSSGIGKGSYVDFGGFDSVEAETRNRSVIVPVTNLVDDLSWTLGKHAFSLGINYRRVNNMTSSDALAYDSSGNSYAALQAVGIANTGTSFDPAAFGYSAVDPSFTTSYNNAIVGVAGIIDVVTNNNNYRISSDGKTGVLQQQGASLNRHFRQNEFEYYFQDSWHLNARLNIIYGFRHSLLQTPYEAGGQQIAPTTSLHDWFMQRGANAARGISNQPLISFGPSGQARGLKPFWGMNLGNIAPRLSIVYAPSAQSGLSRVLWGGDGKSSIRVGYGMYYDHFGQGIVNTFNQFGALGLTSQIVTPTSSLSIDAAPRFTGLHDIPTINGPAPSTVAYPYQAPTDPLTTGFAITRGLDDQLKTPYSHVFDLSIQRQIPGGFTLEANYIGRFGRHLLQQIDLAQPLNLVDAKSGMDYYTAGTILSKATDQGVTNVAAIPYFENLFPDAKTSTKSATQNIYDSVWKTFRGNETVSIYLMDILCFPGCGGQTQRFWSPQYSSLFSWASIGTSSYNAGQLILRHPMTHGLQFDFSYTLAKSMDLGSDSERINNAFGSGNSTFSAIVDAWSPRKNRGVSDFDTRHLITANWLVNLPFGHGHQFGATSSPLVNGVIGGWQLTGLGRWASGLPFSVSDGAGWTTNWYQRSAMVRTGPIKMRKHLDSSGAPQAFDNPSLALQNMRNPYPGETGERNAFRGDGYLGLDSGLSKTWSLYREQTLKFDWEVFNITNSARFDTNTNSSLTASSTSGSFGRYSGLLTAPRVMQISLRYGF